MRVRSLGWEDILQEVSWQPTPVFLPGESRGQRSLAGYSPQGCTESDMTEATSSVTGDPMISAETALKTNKQTKNFYFSDQLRIKSFLAFKINVKDNLKILASNVCSLK